MNLNVNRIEIEAAVKPAGGFVAMPHRKVGNLAKYVNIVRELAVADFRLKYHDSALGYAWSMLNPIFLFIVYHFVFSYLFVSQVPKFTLYLLSGIVFWNFFGDATLSSMSALQSKAALAKKIYFPRALIIFSSTVTAMISFVINTILVWIVVMIFDHTSLHQPLLVLPFLLIILLATGISFILGVAYIYFKDILQIWNVCLNVGFWLTPIVYNALTAPAPLKTAALLLNPVGRILVMLRAFLIYDDFPSAEFMITTPIFCLVLFWFGYWLFQKHEHRITEYL